MTYPVDISVKPDVSAHFDEALYEICWTYIRRAERAEQPEAFALGQDLLAKLTT